MSLLKTTHVRLGQFDMDQAKSAGRELHDQYVSAEPFPHIVVDDFLDPDLLNAALEHFPTTALPEAESHEARQEHLKTSYNPDYLAPEARALFYSFNARPFVSFLENLTGIKGLIPDPHFTGGGFHQTLNGGLLGVHADFNYHPLLKVERRINALIYLNKDWKSEYGGQLELWDKAMKTCMKRVDPIFNRLVVFNTSSDSYHGHPDPLRHPDNKPRRSIALYYYTATWDDTKKKHSTLFRVRPESEDVPATRNQLHELLHDLTPPLLLRTMRRLRRASSARTGD